MIFSSTRIFCLWGLLLLVNASSLQKLYMVCGLKAVQQLRTLGNRFRKKTLTRIIKKSTSVLIK